MCSPLNPQSEMEDLCFAVLHPTAYCTLRAELDRLWSLPTLTVVEEQLGEQQGGQGQGQGAGGEGDLGLGLRIVASTPTRHYTRAAGMRAASGRGRGRRGGAGTDGLLPEAGPHERAAAEEGSSMGGREGKDKDEEEGRGRGQGGTGAVAHGSATMHASAVAAGPSLAAAGTSGSRVHVAGVESGGAEGAATATASHAHPTAGGEQLQAQQQQAVCGATTQVHRVPAGGPALSTSAAAPAPPAAPAADTALRLPAWMGTASGDGGTPRRSSSSSGSYDGAHASVMSMDGSGGDDGSPAGSLEALPLAHRAASYPAAGVSTATATASAGVVARVGVSISTLESVDGPLLLDGLDLGDVYGSSSSTATTTTTTTTMTSTTTSRTTANTSSSTSPLPGVSRAMEGPEDGVQPQPLPEPLPLSPGLIAAAPGSPGAVSDRPPAAPPAPLAPLLPQQQRLQLILSTVVPFESVGFKDFKGLANSTR